jgi:hypothetical protein
MPLVTLLFTFLDHWERTLPGSSSRDVLGMVSGGTSSLAVVGSQEFDWPMVCPVSQLSTLMCVIPVSKGSLSRMGGGDYVTKSSMESRNRHSALSSGCWKVWKIFNFTFRFSNLIFIIPVLQFMFALL